MPELLRLRACTVDPIRREVRRDDGRVERLTPREADLLAWLARNPDRIVTRDELLEHVWGYAPTVVTRVVDTTVRRLREKVEADPQAPDHVLTSFGEGYRFVAGAPVEPPPLEPEEEPFVGRDAEVAALVAAASRAGTVSVLLGPPGAGKTRIARHLAWRLSRLRAPIFVDVTEARDRAQVAALLALALGIEAGESGAVALRRAGDALRGRGPCLVVLDNCEGVSADVAETLAALRAAAPDARFLVTSRVRVPVVDATEVPVGALAVAQGVELFAVLAARVRPTFVVDDPALLEELVARLEGIPLAIALAAGRSGALSPRAILDRLDDRFRLLASKSRDADPRQRTLTAALDASWELLRPAEQETLAACSAFRGGFDAAAATEVVGRPDTEALVASLCASSLLDRRGERFGGYAFVREYAAARLARDPRAEARVFVRHGEVYAARFDAAGEARDRGRALSRDRANLVAATERAVAAGRTDVARRCGLGALDVIGREGPFEQGTEVARLLLSLADLPAPVRIFVRQRLAVIELWGGLGDPSATLDVAMEEARVSGDPESQSHVLRARGMVLRARGRAKDSLPVLEEALALARAAGSFEATANAMSALGIALRELGRVEESRAAWVELLAAAEARQDAVHVVHASGNLALAERRLGRVDRARELYERSLAWTVASGDRRAEVNARVGLGNLELDAGRYDRAREHYLASLVVAREVGVRESEARILGNLGLLERARGNVELALGHLHAALRAFEQVGDLRQSVLCRGNLGEAELAAGHPEEARELLTDAVDELARMSDGPSEAELSAPLVDVLLALDELAEARGRVDRAEALARAAGSPMILAQVLARRGLVELAEGRPADATLAEAEPLAASVGAESDTARAVARLRAELSSRSRSRS